MASCTEVWELKIDGDNSEVAHTLCVAANAAIAGGELSFAAAVAPVRSDVIAFETYPLDGLRLELIVDGVSYYSDSLQRNSLFGKESGFRIANIPVDTKTPVVEMIIRDSLGNYDTVKASATAMETPEMNVRVTSVKVKDHSRFRGINHLGESIYDSMSYSNCDSIYVATISFKDAPLIRNYYMINIEFECFEDIFNISDGSDKDSRYLVKSFGEYDSTKFKKMGFFPFYSEEDIFQDENITASLFGYRQCFRNVFDDSTFDGIEKTITISFNNLFPQICKSDFRENLWLNFSSNGETPFHIYLTQIGDSDYNNYIKIMYHLCSGGSLFNLEQAFTSKLDGGLGFFSVLNSMDYFYYDDRVYCNNIFI